MNVEWVHSLPTMSMTSVMQPLKWCGASGSTQPVYGWTCWQGSDWYHDDRRMGLGQGVLWPTGMAQVFLKPCLRAVGPIVFEKIQFGTTMMIVTCPEQS